MGCGDEGGDAPGEELQVHAMKCDICHEREAKHEIDGWRVCVDSWCKMDAWTFDGKEIRGQWGGGNNSGNAADPRPDNEAESEDGVSK